ncbi:MAG: tetratricopeptide repeat protein, partial [Telmatospirillum sp.]|nr:tetratricopeptide repeat protein [Telmatospirillum sp.]
MPIRRLAFLILIVNAIVDPGAFAAPPPPQSEAVPGQSGPGTGAAPGGGAVGALQQRLSDHDARMTGVERKMELLTQRFDDQDKSLNTVLTVNGVEASRVGIIVGAIGAFFGTLITAIVVSFSIRTHASAVAEARADSRQQLQDYKEKFDTLAEEGRRNAEQIRSMLDDALGRTSDYFEKIRAIHDNIARLHGEAESGSQKLKALIEEAERRQSPQPAGMSAPTSSRTGQGGLALAALGALPASAQGFDSWYLRGLAAHEDGRYTEALEAYARADDLAPDVAARAKLLNAEASAHWYLRQWPEALARYQRVI